MEPLSPLYRPSPDELRCTCEEATHDGFTVVYTGRCRVHGDMEAAAWEHADRMEDFYADAH